LLRNKAIEHFSENNHIKCAVCGFDFYNFYGEQGKNYIQIHHEKPIFEYDDDGMNVNLDDALKNVKPLCANCHCMIHRKRQNTLSVEELKNMIKKSLPD
jgi:predicted HNH restriction endonuclease